MKFRRLDATFGKLDHSTLTFSEGLNIIEAPNESGKSTMLAFLRAMLYGLPTRERGALADKNRYAPWSLTPMRGVLELSCRMGDITLQRDTARSSSPMGRFSAVYTGSGEPVEGLSASSCGEQLLGVPGGVFERSAFIRQNSLVIDQDAELERRIAALITTGEEGRSCTEALSALKKQLNARKYNKSGRIPALEAEIAALERAQDEWNELSARKSAAEADLAALEAEERTLDAQLRAHDLCDALEAHRAFIEAQAAAQSAEAEAQRFRQEIANRGTPSREALEQGRALYGALTERKAEAEQAEARRAEAEKALEAFEAAPPRRRSFLPYIIIAALSFGFFLFSPSFSGSAAWIGQLISTAALLMLLGAEGVRLYKNHKVCSERLEALEHALQKASSDAAAQQNLYLSILRELLALIPVPDVARIPACIDAAFAQYSQADALAQRAREARLRCEMLAGQPQPAVPDEPPERPVRSRAELQASLRGLQARRREAQSICDYTSGRLRAIGDAPSLTSELSGKRAALAQAQSEYDALLLAIDALQTSNAALQSRFSPALSRRAAALFSRLTGGAYDRVLLDRSFSALTGASGEGVSRSAAFLSLGALDQLYLAVRLAICEAVLPADDPIPLVLDDALVRFDDARCRAALDLLYEESHTRQILLFTCQRREAACLAGRPGIAVLSL